MMELSITDNGKSRGRPETGIGRPVGLRLYPHLEQALDAYCEDQLDGPGRPEAIRRILTAWLKENGYLPR